MPEGRPLNICQIWSFSEKPLTMLIALYPLLGQPSMVDCTLTTLEVAVRHATERSQEVLSMI